MRRCSRPEELDTSSHDLQNELEGRGFEFVRAISGTSTPRLFGTRPACAMREDDSSGRARFVLVGKSTDNKLYASTGHR